MLDLRRIAAYCERFGFNLTVSDRMVWIDGAKFDSFEHAIKSIELASSNDIWQDRPDAADIGEVEELLPETHINTFNLQPLVADLPENAVAYVSLTAVDNVVQVTLVAAHKRVSCALQIDSRVLLAVIKRGDYELSFQNKALTISYVV